MNWIRQVINRRRIYRDLADEMRQHLDESATRFERDGMSREEAERAARRKFGNVALLEERSRGTWQWPVLESAAADLRYALRQLRKSPGFTATAVVTLGLGIGVNTAIFSIVNSVLLRPLPVQDPQRIVYLTSQSKKTGAGNGFSIPDFEDIRQQSGGVFSGITAIRLFETDGLSIDGRSQNLWTGYVTGNFFSVMGVKPVLGRLIQPGEGNVIGADPVLVLSYAYWNAHFHRDPKIVGTKVTLSGRPVTIIGVAPEGFHGVSSLFEMQGYLPLSMCPFEGIKEPWTRRDADPLLLLARLKDGIDLGQAQSALDVIARRLAQTHPQYHEGMLLHAYRLPPIGPSGGPPDPALAAIAGVFLALAAGVLVLACFNVANLVLVRATVRQREIALRAALGASRGRLVRQLLTESVLLALLGCISGIAAGLAAAHIFDFLPIGADFPLVLDFGFDWRVFVYGLGASMLCAAVLGLVPALRASSTNAGEILHDSGRTVSARRQRLRSALVVAQVSGSLMLLIVAGLFIRSLIHVQRTDLVFDPRPVMNFSMDPHKAGYGAGAGRVFYGNLLERARALPGIQAASLAATVPMGYYMPALPVTIAGRQASPPDLVHFNSVSTGYFETMQIPLLRGRDFSHADGPQYVVVINQAMAKHYWPDQDPLGKQFTATIDGQDHSLEIIGVAKDSRTSNLSGPIGPYLYTSLAQTYTSSETLQVRTAGTPQSATHAVLALVHSLAPSMPVSDVQTMSRALDTFNGLLLYDIGAGLAASMGILGLTLAIVGMYGVLSYATAQRTHEIGIRMALGAQGGDVLTMILRQGVLIVALGLAIGILAAAGMGRLVANLLVDVSGTDPITYAAVSLSLGLVALVACYIPARRAARVDPMVALRYE
jgi:predicted permease